MRKAFLGFMVEAARALIAGCRERGLRCRDPPLATSRLLSRIGLNQYQERAFWSDAQEASGREYIIYRYRRASFSLGLSVVESELLHIDGWLPADYFDCRLLGDACSKSPRGKALYAYVSSSVAGNSLRINAVNLLRILDMTVPGLVDELLDGVSDAVWGRGHERLVNAVLKAAGLESIRIVLPAAPKDRKDLLSLSPLLARLLKG
jgi:hypothetical protein